MADRWLFAEQDTVEAAWRVVDPVLGDVTPVHPYAIRTWVPRRPTASCRTVTPGTTPPDPTSPAVAERVEEQGGCVGRRDVADIGGRAADRQDSEALTRE
jgi:hypothetical protein